MTSGKAWEEGLALIWEASRSNAGCAVETPVSFVKVIHSGCSVEIWPGARGGGVVGGEGKGRGESIANRPPWSSRQLGRVVASEVEKSGWTCSRQKRKDLLDLTRD